MEATGDTGLPTDPDPTDDPGTDTGDTGGDPGHTGDTGGPVLPEVACSGADEDRDGLPGFSTPCTSAAPDVVLAAPPPFDCCLRWTPVPDQTGDRAQDVLLEQIYATGAVAVGPSAWIAPATTSGDVVTLAVASFAFPIHQDDGAEGNGGAVGEFDGAPGDDVWVRGHLFTGLLVGAFTADDAVAVLDGGSPRHAADLDGDGVDDLAQVESVTTGTYHSGGYHTTLTLQVARGPFPGGGWEDVTERTGRSLALFDADGDGTPELAHATSESASAPIVVEALDGPEFARFERWITVAGDLDGDGFDDVYAGEASTERVSRWFAGPFSGTFDPDTHPLLVSYGDLPGPRGLPDLNGDGTAELLWTDAGRIGVVPSATGDQGTFDPTTSPWQTEASVNSVPPGGPFVGQLGGDRAADLGLGVILIDRQQGVRWNPEFWVYHQPLY